MHNKDLPPVPSLLNVKTLSRKNTKNLLLPVDAPSAELALLSLKPKRQTVVSLILPTRLPSLECSTPIATTSSLKEADLVHLKHLGSGNFGVVTKVFHVPLQRTMARKVVHVDLNAEVQRQILRELQILHECKLPHIVEFFGAFLCNSSLVLCMEYCNCGSLDKVAACAAFPVPVLRMVLFAVLSGLEYLYNTHKIIHRDIKPSNVLMTHRGEFRLCDFGVLRQLTNSLAMADTFVGTSTYMAPERIQGLRYGVKLDVWLLGLVLYELASGKTVWSDGHSLGPEGILDLLQRIVNEDPPRLADGDPELCAFVDMCLVKRDTQRLPPEQLLKSAFLRGAAEGRHDAEVRAWAKQVRRMVKEKQP